MWSSDGLQIGAGEAASYLAKFGSPLFLFDEDLFVRRLRALRLDAKAGGLRARLLYSYKTNSVTALCQLADREGYDAEVVSGPELRHALRLGVPGHRIVLNGPMKDEATLQQAISEGVTIHADSLDELEQIARLTEASQRPVKAGARLQVDLGPDSWSKFGIEPAALLRWIEQRALPRNLEVVGLHMHIGTNITDPNRYASPLREMLSSLQAVERLLGHRLGYLDVGGGMAASRAIPLETLPGDWLIPDPVEYFRVFSSELEAAGRSSLEILLEPGRLLVAPCMHYLCRVHCVKRSAGRTLVITDGNINHLPSAYYLRHPIVGLAARTGTIVRADIFGPVCTQFDNLGVDVELPEPRPGDPLLIQDVGAYTLAFSNQFVLPRPPVVALSSTAEPFLIRRREDERAFWQDDLPL